MHEFTAQSHVEDLQQHEYDLPYHWCRSPFHNYVIQQGVQRFSDIVRGKTVLGVGCGDGYVTSLLATQAKYVLGFDISERAIAFAKLIVQMPNAEFVVGQARDVLDIAKRIDDGPEVVAAFELIEHLPRTEAETFLPAVRQTLRERKGWLIGTTPNAERRRKPGAHAHYHGHEFGVSELIDTLRSAGFENVEVSGLYLQPRSRRLEHYANTIPFRGVFRALARAGKSGPRRCRTLVFRAQAV